MKAKICFVCLSNMYLVPYLSKYEENIDNPYDVIYWNRHGVKETSSAENLFPFEYQMNENLSKKQKLVGYIKFRAFAKSILEKNNYDGVIVLHTTTGILLKSVLKKYYKKKYIIDIRDYTMEKNPLFYAFEKDLIEHSALAVISSKGYESFLPKYDYVLSHNDISISKSTIRDFRNTKIINENKISISFIGLIRFHEQNKKVIARFANDQRFVLNFIGADAFALRSYCENLKVSNVNLIDRFPPEKTMDYYKMTDMINNLYGNNSMLLDYALSNKLYYAALLGLPILVSPDTYMEEVACNYGFGYSVDLNSDTVCDDIYHYYRNIDWEEFYDSCDQFLLDVNADNEKFKKAINNYILDIKE
ncbi:capsular biosynthesis protein [Bacillus sp. AFS075960]|nr:capsular biosynthesis protein [Bacillus cereus]PFW83004.1 capsular biosynthesis protein [Bacillus sp. AFS075960]PGT96021.1 capsular biosynthesis protein [Bacillus cereus]